MRSHCHVVEGALELNSMIHLSIIAVHGINVWGNETHAENTWTHDKTGVNWLRTLLPQLLPHARVLAFQYNANVAFGTSTAGVQQQAVNLLGCLKMVRKVCSLTISRP